MKDSFENIIDFNFYNYDPIFAQGEVSIVPPILERLENWKQNGSHFEVELSEMNTSLPFGDADVIAIKIPKGQVAKIEYDGFMGIYTPKIAPTLGGVANYEIGRVYPKENHIIIFESKNNSLSIEQNLVEDYHHVIFRFGKEINKKNIFSESVSPVVTPQDVELSENEKKVLQLEEELKRLKGEI